MSTKPLLCHPPLLPGESLSSFTVRLAKLNDYDLRSMLSILLRDPENLTIRSLRSISQADIFQNIALLTDTKKYDLYRGTIHYFAPILTPIGSNIESLELTHNLSVPLFSEGVAHKNLCPESASQFCPFCLKIAAYHRLIWFSNASSACLEHKCLLARACPNCGGRIKLRDIIEVICSKCKTDLSEVHTLSVKEDHLGLFAQGLIQSWLMERVNLISTVYPLPTRCAMR